MPASPVAYSLSQLPPPARERLVRDLESGKVFFFEPVSKAFWLASGGVALFGAVVVLSLALSRSMGLDFISVSGALMGAWAILAFGVAIYLALRQRGLPFTAGRYVIGHQLIDAPGDRIKVYSVLDLQDIKATHQFRNGFYQCTWVELVLPSGTFKFRVQGQQRAEAALAAFDEQLRIYRQAAQSGNSAWLAAQGYFSDT